MAMVVVLMTIAGLMVVALFRFAAAGQPLHHDFADKAAAVDGEMVDVISNMPLVWSFCGRGREYRRFDATVAREMEARRSSLLYLERLRIGHAAVTIVIAIGMRAWAVILWEQGAVTAGDVVLACTLGLAVLHATRDLAVHRSSGRSELMSVETRPTKGASPPAPAAVVVMGVSGCGKSTIGALLASRLRWEFEDADWFHPASNVDKMHSGIALTEEDRWPWLDAVATWIDQTRRSGGHGVIACSALKRRYRDVLIGDRADVRLVYLKGDETLIARRIATRHEHFMPRSLLHSQFEVLEEPGLDENPITVPIEPQPREVVARILSAMNITKDSLREQSSLQPSGADA